MYQHGCTDFGQKGGAYKEVGESSVKNANESSQIYIVILAQPNSFTSE